MSKRLFLSLSFALLASSPSATTILVPADQPSIQAGVDAADDGDTVRVAPGLYIENVEIIAKDVLLVSDFLWTSNTEDVQATIIDGDSVSSVVIFENCSRAAGVIGFTIRNGCGIQRGVGRYGGGIDCFQADVSIESNYIVDNRGASVGGGIRCWESSPWIVGNTVAGNFAKHAPGVAIGNGFPVLKNCIVWINENSDYPGTTYRSDLYLQNLSQTDISWSDIFAYDQGLGNLPRDPLFVDPGKGDYTLFAQSACIDAGDLYMTDPDGSRVDIGVFQSDPVASPERGIWHVAPNGNDAAGDSSSGNPFRTIQFAVNRALYGDTVMIQPGTYVENVAIIGKGLTLASTYILSENEQDITGTIIDAGGQLSALRIEWSSEPATVEGLTLTNGYGTHIWGDPINRAFGGGLFCRKSGLSMKHCNVVGNSATDGAGVSVSLSSGSTVSVCVFRDNHTRLYMVCDEEGCGPTKGSGGGLLSYSPIEIRDSEFRGNSSLHKGGGAALYGDSQLDSCLFVENECETYGGGLSLTGLQSTVRVSNCDFEQNRAQAGGGVYCDRVQFEIDRCNFVQNSAGWGAGMRHVGRQSSFDGTILNSVFDRNIAAQLGGALETYKSGLEMNNCTVVGNQAAGGSAIRHREANSAWQEPTMDACIIAFGSVGQSPISCRHSSVTMTNCDVFGNEGGDWIDCIEGQDGLNGNFSADPEFCDAPGGDLSLWAVSPCTPNNSPSGGLIGALDAGCFDCGDTNADGEVTAADLELLYLYYFGLNPTAPYPIAASDLSCDGILSLADIILLSGWVHGYGPPPCCAPNPKPPMRDQTTMN